MKLGGIVTAMVTPFGDSGDVDLAEAARLAEWLASRDNRGLVVAGTTGEGPALSVQERLQLFGAVKNAVRDRAVIIANTGSNDTRASVALTKDAEATGVDAILAVVPYYNKPTQDGMLGHFGAIANATSLPVIIYNIPGRTGANMLPETLLELTRRHGNIKGVKESSGDLSQFGEILRRRPGGFTFFCGDDHLFLPSLALGADGVIGVATHLCSREFARMARLLSDGHAEDAARLHFELMPLFSALFATTSPIPIKWAMNEMGFRTGECRLPLGKMPHTLKAPLRTLIERFRESAVAS